MKHDRSNGDSQLHQLILFLWIHFHWVSVLSLVLLFSHLLHTFLLHLYFSWVTIFFIFFYDSLLIIPILVILAGSISITLANNTHNTQRPVPRVGVRVVVVLWCVIVNSIAVF